MSNTEPDTTPTGPTADETVERLIREASGHVSGEGLRLDVDELRRVLHLAITAGASAWRERAEQAEDRAARYKACVESDDALLQAVIEAMGSRSDRDPVIAARELVAERDALRARIKAALSVFDTADVLDEVAVSMRAALAGDQPALKLKPLDSDDLIQIAAAPGGVNDQLRAAMARGEFAYTPPRGTCARPPVGWWCSLHDGHDGACPARPEEEEEEGQAGDSTPEPPRYECRHHHACRSTGWPPYFRHSQGCVDWNRARGVQS